jgi:ABC-2 type transport system ATP-binding protein
MRVEVSHLTKRYGPVTAVSDLTFTVEPGVVTGFLGLNGAGKTTTMRMLTGLVSPTSGTATIDGRPYQKLDQPSRTVGSVFDASAFHPAHTARDHLRVYAAMGGHPDSRVTALLEQLGLAEAAHRRTAEFSTGMRQRLALATALLGDPRVLLLDEPSNGLDPEGMLWLRGFLRRLADEGRTVLISSHVLSEVQQLVDDVIVIRRGELVAAGPWSKLAGPPTVLVRSPDADRLVDTLRSIGEASSIEVTDDGGIRIRGMDAPGVGDLAAEHGLRVHQLVSETSSLEQLFLHLTTEEVAPR